MRWVVSGCWRASGRHQSDAVGLTMCVIGISLCAPIVSLRYSKCTWRSVLSVEVYVNGGEEKREEKRYNGETKPRGVEYSRWHFRFEYFLSQRAYFCRDLAIVSIDLSRISNQSWKLEDGVGDGYFLFADRPSTTSLRLSIGWIIDLR